MHGYVRVCKRIYTLTCMGHSNIYIIVVHGTLLSEAICDLYLYLLSKRHQICIYTSGVCVSVQVASCSV